MLKKMMLRLSLIFAYLFVCHIHAIPSHLGTIHVCGDSHLEAFRTIPYCKTHYFEGFTMHRVGRDQLQAVDLRKLNIAENDIVIFTFGEIDVRCHIGKQRDLKHRAFEEIIDTLATKYIQTVVSNKKFFSQIKCIVYGIVPPSDLGGDNPSFPRYGTISDRIYITQQLNQRLALECAKYGIDFMNPYPHYSTPEGRLIVEYSDGLVHISEKKNQKLRELLSNLLRNSHETLSKIIVQETVASQGYTTHTRP